MSGSPDDNVDASVDAAGPDRIHVCSTQRPPSPDMFEEGVIVISDDENDEHEVSAWRTHFERELDFDLAEIDDGMNAEPDAHHANDDGQRDVLMRESGPGAAIVRFPDVAGVRIPDGDCAAPYAIVPYSGSTSGHSPVIEQACASVSRTPIVTSTEMSVHEQQSPIIEQDRAASIEAVIHARLR